MTRPRGVTHLAGAAVILVLAACRSPEAARVRGDGLRGADPNNRDPVIEMHAGSRMYYDTPCLLPNDSCTGPVPASGLPGDFPEPARKQDRRK